VELKVIRDIPKVRIGLALPNEGLTKRHELHSFGLLGIRAATEALTVDEDALGMLSEAGSRSTLRYAVQLLAPAAVSSKICGRSNVTAQDISDVGELFYDAKTSAEILQRNADKYML